MDEHPERRRYYPLEENVPLSEAVREAVGAQENASLGADGLKLYEEINPEAIDTLFEGSADSGADISVRIDLENVTVSIWSDTGIDIRVIDRIR